MNLNIKQELAFDKLSKLRAGALFMKMGTGKTKVALDLIKSKENDIDLIIWIAPASLVKSKNYRDEIKKWNKLTKPIHFYSIEGVSASDVMFLEMYNLAKNSNNFCVIDESITIKNTDAGRTQRILRMYDLFNFRLILNGTPLTKGLIDLYSQIKFISPKILNMTEAQFANKFLVYKKDGFKPWKRWSKPENEEALIEMIRPYIFDCELDLHVKINNFDFDFNLNEEENEFYKNEKYDYLKDKDEVNFLSFAQKFQNIYTHALAKKEKLKNLVKCIIEKKEKVIIYVKFLSEIEYIKDNFDCVVLTGNQKDDLSLLKEKNILLCTYGVGSLGLNLQICNNIIYYSQTFDYKDKEQSLHRIYRTGQVKECNIYNFWVNVGLEDLIQKSLDKKQKVLKNVSRIISKEECLKL